MWFVRFIASCALIVCGMAISPRPAMASVNPLQAPPQVPRQALLDRYCVPCHNQKSKTAGLVLENSESEQPASRPEFWEKVIRKLDAGEMPPAGMPRPDATAQKAFTAGLIK